MAEPTISIGIAGGEMTPPVPMSALKGVLDEVKGKGRRKVPMKETEADKAVTDRACSTVGEELRQFIERYEHLAEEKAEIAGQQKEVMAEAKGRGYDTKALRKIVALRKRKPEEVAEEEAVLELYKAALGMV